MSRRVLMVPTHLDALYLGEDTPALGAFVDFSRLPGRTGSSAPYLADSLTTRPFADRSHRMCAGVHLHWSLPDALCKGKAGGPLLRIWGAPTITERLDASAGTDDPAGIVYLRRQFELAGRPLPRNFAILPDRPGEAWKVTSGAGDVLYRIGSLHHFFGSEYRFNPGRYLVASSAEIAFPRVPNRWLVTRREGDEVTGEWVVESDYVHPPDTEAPDAVAFPWPADPDRPWRHVGRTLALADWRAAPASRDQCLDRLTAVGHGDPTFAAFYPNCRGIFGFHDTEIAGRATLPDALRYDVLGFYSDPARDPARSEWLDMALEAELSRHGYWPDARHDRQKARMAERVFGTLLFQTLESAFGWHVARDRDEDVPQLTGVYARAVLNPGTFDTRDCSARLGTTPVDIAVGNTGHEALSAYLGHRLDGDGAGIEDQIEAVHLATHLDRQHVDLGPKFREARHEKAFAAQPGGIRWTLAPADTGQDGAEVPPTPAPPGPGVAALLHDLNAAQVRLEDAEAEDAAARDQLFADWHKYLSAAHPTGAQLQTEPGSDAIRAYLEQQALPGAATLHDRVRLCQLHCRLAVIGLQIALLTADPDGYWELRPSPAPRFWRPRDPVVLLAGEAARASARHGEDGDLPCTMGRVTAGKLGDCLPEVAALVDRIIAEGGPGYAHRAAQPWHPLLLEWDVAFHPAHGLLLDAAEARTHDPRFVTSTHGLSRVSEATRDSSDLTRADPDGDNAVTPPDRYAGRAILTPDAMDHLAEGLDAYLERALLPRYLDHAGVYPKDRDKVSVALKIADMDDWFERASGDWKTPATARVLETYRTALPRRFAISRMVRRLETYLADTAMPDYLIWDAEDPGSGTPELLEERFDAFAEWLRAGEVIAGEPMQLLVLDLLERLLVGRAPPRDLARRLAILIEEGGFGAFRTENAVADLPPEEALLRHLDAFAEARGPDLDTPTALALDAFRLFCGSGGYAPFFCVSQSLDGFHDALLMRHAGLQLPVADPNGLEADRAFAKRMAEAIGDRTRFTIRAHRDFHPLRAGHMTFKRLRLVDTFGQVHDLDCSGHVIAATSMTERTRPNRVHLRPRLCQPARLDFRLLAAGHAASQSHGAEMAEAGIADAVHGWIVLNHVDRDLIIYGANGRPEGIVVADGAWLPFPGHTPMGPDAIQDQHLGAVIKTVLAGDVPAFISGIERVLARIEPAALAQREAMALLTGRPLAVIRARLKLQVPGRLAVDQSWAALGRDIATGEGRATDGFGAVRFPVHLGDTGQLNDGLVAIWTEETGAGGKLGTPGGGSPLIDEAADLDVALDDPPHFLTLLVDPRGVIHARTGLLPTKAIGLDLHHSGAAISRIETAFRAGPILVPSDSIALPVPHGPGTELTWLERAGGDWVASTIEPPETRAQWGVGNALTEGWMKIAPGRKG